METDDDSMTRMWKEFGKQTQAGKLLYDIYGVRYRPEKFVSYPKLNVKSKEQIEEEKKKGQGIPNNNNKEATSKISYPDLRKKYSNHEFHKIDFVPKRKKEEQIKQEISAIKTEINKRTTSVRAPVRNRNEMISNLQENFQFQERTVMPKGARLPGLKAETSQREEPKVKAAPKKGSKEELLVLYDSIMAEIDERYKYMEDIKKLGKNKDRELMVEIKDRIEELKKIQKLIEAYPK